MTDREESANHTAGPWIMAAKPSSVVGWPVVGAGGASICSLSWLGKQPDGVSDERFAAYRAEVEANGRLIAAAPAMEKALREIVDQFANQDLNHVDFRLGAMTVAEEALRLAGPSQ